MTYEEALEILRPCEIILTRSTSRDTLALALCVAEEALEKQMPQKPFENTPIGAVCPTCGGSISMDNVLEYIIYGETSFCEHCGQAIDWSDYEKD